MLHKTRGIVLKSTRHSESSIVCKLYTEKFGLQSYLIHGARRRNAKIPAAILQPLHTLDMVVYHKENGNLQRISEARQSPLFQTIPYDIEKNTIALFLAEVLNKVIKQSESDSPLFEFIYTMITWFDKSSEKTRNFHLFFLLKLTQYLGFYPMAPSARQETPKYLRKGASYPIGETWSSINIRSPLSIYWHDLLACKVESINDVSLNTHDRRQLLGHIIAYYQEHIEMIEPLKSRAVLEAIWE